MFRRFAKFISDAGGNGAIDLMRLHPSDLTALLEFAWDSRSNNPDHRVFGLGHPARRSDLDGFGTTWFGDAAFKLTPPSSPTGITVTSIRDGIRDSGETPEGTEIGRDGILWDHLIYAYMIENTRIYEVFRRVIHELLHGEKLGVPGSSVSPLGQEDSQRWLRATEEMFYRDPPPFYISAITSHVRADLRATRRNAYQRMFGMDLNHGTDDNQSYPYVRAEVANSEFVSTFEEFVREVWIGIENRNNQNGANPTDDAKIADLAEKLHAMLQTRRESGNLSREEFFFVSMLSWFHLTVDNDLPIIEDLRAQATTPDERLFKIAQRVGLPAHGLSRSYFEIADSISRILIEIETGLCDVAAAAPALYTERLGGGGPDQAMRTIIRHWSIITGREMKARRVTPS
jgi:hypothetical protein